jgi:uncharacterized protein YxeA
VIFLSISVFKAKKVLVVLICILVIILITSMYINIFLNQSITVATNDEGKKYIKWVSFNVTYPALKKALNLDISSHNGDGYRYNWVEILSYLGAKYGGNFDRYKESDMDAFVKRIATGEKVEDITKDMKYYNYYLEAYTAVLGEFVGNYKVEVSDGKGGLIWQEKYGLKVFSPIAQGYYYNDYDDFGSRKGLWI